VLAFSFFGLSFYFAMYTVVGYGVIIGRLTRKYYPNENGGPPITRLIRYIKGRKKHKLSKSVKSE
jgi:hypothetical protein